MSNQAHKASAETVIIGLRPTASSTLNSAFKRAESCPRFVQARKYEKINKAGRK